jgi:hypothetical protein
MSEADNATKHRCARHIMRGQYPAFAPQPNIALQLTPTASLLVPYASLRRR